jgi:hypothetical protein
MTASGFVNCFARIQRANRMMLARQWKRENFPAYFDRANEAKAQMYLCCT